jgi:hypothetical protein
LDVATDDQTSKGVPQQKRRELRFPSPGTPPETVEIREEPVKRARVPAPSRRSAVPTQVQSEIVETGHGRAGSDTPKAARVLSETVHGEQAATRAVRLATSEEETRASRDL